RVLPRAAAWGSAGRAPGGGCWASCPRAAGSRPPARPAVTARLSSTPPNAAAPSRIVRCILSPRSGNAGRARGTRRQDFSPSGAGAAPPPPPPQLQPRRRGFLASGLSHTSIRARSVSDGLTEPVANAPGSDENVAHTPGLESIRVRSAESHG